jgi:carbamoyl-phosphate synthase small subunit
VDPELFEKPGFVLTHTNLNDGTVEGFRLADRPVISVQYHPEASPGPHDSHYLFEEFVRMMRARREGR